MTEGIVIGALLSAAMQLVGHWFKWEVWLGRGLHRVLAYAWGVSAMLLGLLAWAVVCHDQVISVWLALLAVVVVMVVSGAATLFGYAMDALGERVHYARTRDTMDAATRGVKA